MADLVTGWADRRWCLLDTETTGIDVTADQLVTASVQLVGGGLPPVARSWLARVPVIPAEATAVHGITAEYAMAHGDAPLRVLTEIAHCLVDAMSQDIPLVAYNAPFDLGIIDCQLRHYGPTGLSVATYNGWVLDPLVIDKHVDPYRRGSRKLVDTCAHYGVVLDDAHTAEADALAAGRLLWKIAQRYPEVAAMSLEDLHAAQVGWYRDQMRSLAAHFRRKGKDASGIHEEWPQRTFV